MCSHCRIVQFLLGCSEVGWAKALRRLRGYWSEIVQYLGAVILRSQQLLRGNGTGPMQLPYRGCKEMLRRLCFLSIRSPNVYIFTFPLVLWVVQGVTEPKPKGEKGLPGPPGLQ